MSSSSVAHVRVALAYTVQAIKYTESALIFFQELNSFPLQPNPIKQLFYQDAFDNLTEAYLSIKALPFDTHFSIDPVFLNIPVAPEGQDNQLLITLSDNRISLAYNKTSDTINYIEQTILLSGDNDSLCGQLVFIKLQLEAARDGLLAGLNSPDYIVN